MTLTQKGSSKLPIFISVGTFYIQCIWFFLTIDRCSSYIYLIDVEGSSKEMEEGMDCKPEIPKAWFLSRQMITCHNTPLMSRWWDVTDVILSLNQLEMPKLDVRLIFIMYQSFLAHKISAGLRAQMPSGGWVQLLVVTHTYWFICSSACSLQNCLNKHMYTPEKCDGTLRSLYECCQKMYDADSTSGQENSGSTACPMPKVVTKWLKDHPR